MDTKAAQVHLNLEILDSHMPPLHLNGTAQHGILPSFSLMCPNVKASLGHLAVSPYGGPSHLLDLSTVSKPDQLLAQALTLLQPIRSDYATAPYLDSFNWTTVIESLVASLKVNDDFEWQSEAFYIIVFRSQIPPTTDRSHLFALDELSHAEAMESGGLLKYWFGTPDAEGRNLATCRSLLGLNITRPR